MKLAYIANARMPTEKAHGIQIMKMCEAFAGQDLEVELVAPRRFNHIDEDPFDFYEVEEKFTITRLPTIDIMPFVPPQLRWLAYWINNLIFSFAAFGYALFGNADMYYSRNELPLLYLSSLDQAVFWEAHQPRQNIITRLMLRVVDRIVVISEGLKEFFLAAGYSEENMLVAHDAVDPRKFDIDTTREQAREELDLPQEKKIVMYTGHLYPEKGADIPAQAAVDLSEDYLVVLVGGTDKGITEFREKYKQHAKINVAGRVPHEQVPIWLRAANILVLPNSKKDEYSAQYTSPLKLFEYILSQRPVVATDIPSVRNILDDSQAFFCKPDDAHEMAKTIKYITSNPNEAQKKANNAYQKGKLYTWERRANKILSFIC